MKKYRLGLIALLIVTLLSSGVCAGTDEKSEWTYSITPYLWFSGLDGDITARGNKSPVDIGFSDIWDSLELSFMGRYEAWKDPWGYFIDLLYIDMSDRETLPDLTIDWDVEMWIAEAGMGYRLRSFITEKGLQGRLDLLGGLRYYKLKLGIDPSESPGASGSEDWIDGFIGPRLIYPLSEKWNFIFRGDVGAGDSDLSWTLMTGFQYRRKDNFSLSLICGIRDIDYQSGSGSGKNAFDAQISGPALALTWYW